MPRVALMMPPPMSVISTCDGDGPNAVLLVIGYVRDGGGISSVTPSHGVVPW